MVTFQKYLIPGLLFRQVKTFFVFIMVLCFGACEKRPVQVIPDEVRPYVNKFFEEGHKRGFNEFLFNFELEIAFVDFLDNANGICFSSKHKIELDRYDWENLPPQGKEWLIFHELGHCILERKHLNSKLPNGECKSFMKGNQNNFDCSINLYSSEWRSYYLDELFNEAVLAPEWYDSDAIYLDEGTQKDTIHGIMDFVNNMLEINLPDLNQSRDFIIETTFIKRGTGMISLSWDNKIFQYTNSNVRSVLLLRQDADHAELKFDHFFNNHNFEGDIKLSVKKEAEFYYFYVNENLVHKMEYQHMGNKVFQSSAADELTEIHFSSFYIY